MNQEEKTIETMRRFNRFYTKRIGVITDRYLNSPHSLTEARVLYELCLQKGITATQLRIELGLDAGYLSRILKSYETKGYLKRTRSQADARQLSISLTAKGEKLIAVLDKRSKQGLKKLIAPLSSEERHQLEASMQRIEAFLSPNPLPQAPYLIRFHQPGDMGWVIRQHGILYSSQYQWDIAFEGLVADITSQFIKNYDSKTECCWIAEKDGENIGSVFLVRYSKTIAKLRMLIVTPKAQGLGVGTRLVDECIRFARQAGYKKIRLWTVSILAAARKIYQEKGFHKIKEEANHAFGQDLIDETWELLL